MKKLIIFYSLTGHSRQIAKYIAKKTKADIMEIKPKQDIKSKGFMRIFWGGRQVITKKTPELKPLEKNPNDYDLLIFGTPVWVGTFVPAMRTFLSSYKFKNKKFAVFSSCGSSPGKTVENFKIELKDNELIGSISFTEKEAKEGIEKKLDNWIDKIN